MRSEECEKLPFSLGGGRLLHTLVVFPFLLPAAISLLLTGEKPGLLLHLVLSPFICSSSGESGKKELLFLLLNAGFICLRLSVEGDAALNVSPCTDPLHSWGAVESRAFEINLLFPLNCQDFYPAPTAWIAGGFGASSYLGNS